MLYRISRFNLLCRLVIILQASTTIRLGWWSEHSIPYAVFRSGDLWGLALLLALTACALVGAFDILVNDLMPEKYYTDLFKHNRHFGFMLIGTLYLATTVPTLSIDLPGATNVAIHYLAVTLECVWVAWALIIRAEDEGRPYAT